MQRLYGKSLDDLVGGGSEFASENVDRIEAINAKFEAKQAFNYLLQL